MQDRNTVSRATPTVRRSHAGHATTRELANGLRADSSSTNRSRLGLSSMTPTVAESHDQRRRSSATAPAAAPARGPALVTLSGCGMSAQLHAAYLPRGAVLVRDCRESRASPPSRPRGRLGSTRHAEDRAGTDVGGALARAGAEGEGIVALACVDAGDVREIHDAIPAALRDAGVAPITEVAAAARLSFDHIARMHLGGKGAWRWVISAVIGTFEQNNWAAEFYEEPLGSLVGLDDELSASWGRTEPEVAVAVRDACERQVQLTT